MLPQTDLKAKTPKQLGCLATDKKEHSLTCKAGRFTPLLTRNLLKV